jgi:hypothetical protein
MDLPLVSFGSVFHIGTLDPAGKGNRGSPLEGHGLSFAASDELVGTWERITKLGGTGLSSSSEGPATPGL